MNIYDEIIIGAGISGISYSFIKKLSNFIILEKNDYIGGRIKNIKWNNKFISLGGGVFLPSHNNVINLCKSFDVNIEEYIPKYHFTELYGKKPNEELYYDNFKIIYKSIIQKYYKNKDIIKKNNLTFKEFLLRYFPFRVSKTILENSLYSTNFNADPELFLNNEFLYDCLRIKETKMCYIKKQNDYESGYDYLINNMLKNIDKSKIKLNSTVIEINQKNNLYEIITNDKTYLTKKIILATDIKSQIKFNFNNKIKILLNNVYDSIGYEPYIRIYSFHINGHNLKYSQRTQGLIGKTIIMDDNLLMLCYNESNNAIELNNLLNKLSKTEQIDTLYELFKNHSIEITKPDDIYIQYWNVGMHFCKPNFNIQNELNELENIHNIKIIGEIVSKSHGWVESALSTIK